MIIEFNDEYLKRYVKLIKNILDSKSNDYDLHNSPIPITYILFNFFIIPKNKDKIYNKKWDDLIIDKYTPIKLEKFNVNETNYYLPLNRNYLGWGTVLTDSDLLTIIQVEFNELFGLIQIDKVTGKIVFKAKSINITFTDSDFNDSIFKRTFETGEVFYIIENDSIRLSLKPIKTEFITKLKQVRITKPKIGTLDIETIVKDGKHKPYLYSFYDGKNSYSWFADNATQLFEHILKPKYRNYTFYAHNFSRFQPT